MARRSSLRLQSQPHANSLQTTRTHSGRNRLGCHTCRIRRKKCDEQQDPSKGGSCDTCLRLNIECLGWGPSRPAWCSNEKELCAFKESIKRKIAMKRGGLYTYSDQSSEDSRCDVSSGSSGMVDSEHSPSVPLSPSPDDLVSPLPLDLDFNAAIVDALQTQQFVNLAYDLATFTEISPPLLDTLRHMVDLTGWRTTQVSNAIFDAAGSQQQMRVISDNIQNSVLPMPLDLHGLGYDEKSIALFEVNRTACLLLLSGIRAGLRSSSPEIAGWVKELQAQVNVISFNILPRQYLFAACIAKSFATGTDMTFMNSLIASINDQSVKAAAELLLDAAYCRDSVWWTQ